MRLSAIILVFFQISLGSLSFGQELTIDSLSVDERPAGNLPTNEGSRIVSPDYESQNSNREVNTGDSREDHTSFTFTTEALTLTPRRHEEPPPMSDTEIQSRKHSFQDRSITYEGGMRRREDLDGLPSTRSQRGHKEVFKHESYSSLKIANETFNRQMDEIISQTEAAQQELSAHAIKLIELINNFASQHNKSIGRLSYKISDLNKVAEELKDHFFTPPQSPEGESIRRLSRQLESIKNNSNIRFASKDQLLKVARTALRLADKSYASGDLKRVALEKEIVKIMINAALNLGPLGSVGIAKDLLEFLTGRDYFTGKKLSSTDMRALQFSVALSIPFILASSPAGLSGLLLTSAILTVSKVLDDISKALKAYNTPDVTIPTLYDIGGTFMGFDQNNPGHLHSTPYVGVQPLGWNSEMGKNPTVAQLFKGESYISFVTKKKLRLYKSLVNSDITGITKPSFWSLPKPTHPFAATIDSVSSHQWSRASSVRWIAIDVPIGTKVYSGHPRRIANQNPNIEILGGDTQIYLDFSTGSQWIPDENGTGTYKIPSGGCYQGGAGVKENSFGCWTEH